MKKLIKLSETHYIVVDDSEIKNDWVTNGRDIFRREEMPEYSDEYANRYWQKITHSTQPLERVALLSLSEVEEAINGYSVEKMATKVYPKHEKTGWGKSYSYDNDLKRVGFIEGFNAHKKLAKDKLFTVDDIKNAIAFGVNTQHTDLTLDGIDVEGNNFIKSLLKTEWDIEFVNGKITLI